MTARIQVSDFTDSGDLDTAGAARLVEDVLRRENADIAVHVALVDDAEIRRLNDRYLRKDAPTDVLAFALEEEGEDRWDPEGEGPAAEVVVSVDTARREAGLRGIPMESELAFYLIHGVLHILGYDDRNEADRERMREADARHLEAAGYPRDLFSLRRAADRGLPDGTT